MASDQPSDNILQMMCTKQRSMALSCFNQAGPAVAGMAISNASWLSGPVKRAVVTSGCVYLLKLAFPVSLLSLFLLVFFFGNLFSLFSVIRIVTSPFVPLTHVPACQNAWHDM